jgi:hypothetical protein
MGQVTVDPHILDGQGEEWEDEDGGGWTGPSPYFIVTSDQTELAAEALYKAIIRCKFVGTSGRELTREEDATGEEYTANYCSPVYLTDAGPMAYLDTNGELPRAMGEAMLRILIEEVSAVNIDAYLTTPPIGPVPSGDWPVWEPPE